MKNGREIMASPGVLVMVAIIGLAATSCDNDAAPRDCGVDGHVWGEWVTRAATYYEPGERTRTCYFCGRAEVNALPVLQHNWGPAVRDPAPTCAAPGKETRTCLRCGETNVIDLPMLSHDWGAWIRIIESTLTSTGLQRRYCRFVAYCGAAAQTMTLPVLCPPDIG